MKTIELSKLTLRNFKGVKQKDFDFAPETFIFGANRTGKTTLADAFYWLFFNKDSQGRSDFEIKPLDANNATTEKIETEVSAVVNIDGKSTTIKKVLKEKWVKKRNASKALFEGNTNDFYWNEVPVSLKEFQDKINDLIDETIFKLITNPLAFSTGESWGDRKLPMWQNRRNLISGMVDSVSSDDIIKQIRNKDNAAQIDQITLELNSGKTTEEYRKQLAAQRKNINDSIKDIPTRIDEVNRNLPDIESFEEFEKEKESLESKIQKVDLSINDKLEADKSIQEKKSTLQNEIFELESNQRKVKNDLQIQLEELKKVNPKIQEYKDQIEYIKEADSKDEQSLKTLYSDLDELKSKYKQLEQDVRNKRAEWHKVKDEVVSDDKTICPTCKQSLDEKSASENLKSFEKDKAARLQSIQDEGAALKKRLEDNQNFINGIEGRIKLKDNKIKQNALDLENIKSNLEALESKENPDSKKPMTLEFMLLESDEYKTISKNIGTKKMELQSIKSADVSDLKAEKEELQNSLSEIIEKLSFKTQLENATKRVDELKKEERDLAESMTDIEGLQFALESFVKAQIEAIESKVNKKFDIVQFKLFRTLINGGEEPCCEPLIDGVPFADANTASKINAGVDIINSLCKHFQVTAPIFIDNRESVTTLIKSDSQIINLIVSAEDKEIRIEKEVA